MFSPWSTLSGVPAVRRRPSRRWWDFLDNVPLDARVLGARVMLFGTRSLQTVVGARTVVAVWLAGTTALGAGAYSVTRAMCRDSDVEVGRPDVSELTRPSARRPARS